MDTFSLAEDLEILALIRRCVKKAREPDQRDGDPPSVREKYR
jgi:hypothetical protein